MDAKVADKIRKLLALAQSSNEHEASLAAARASELMLEHKLQGILFDDQRQEQVIEWDLMRGYGRREIWKGLLANASAEAFGCRFYFRKADLVIVGFESQREAVDTTFRYLVQLVNTMVEDWRAKQAVKNHSFHDAFFAPHEVTAENSFVLGVCNTINKRLVGTRRKQVTAARQGMAGDSKTSALVVVDAEQEAVDRYINSKDLTGNQSVGQHIDHHAMDAGAQAGRSVNIGARGIGTASTSKQLK